MQKQLKILDQQLNSNNLTRVITSISRPDKSLFRALSLSLYYNQDHLDQVIRILRLCLVSSCKANQTSSFASPHRKARFLSKFMNSQQTIDSYFLNPDLGCFLYDNLQLASLAFLKQVILFTVSKDGYLQQSLITTCNHKTTDPPIMVAKITNRFYCVQSQSTRSVMMFIKQNIINQLLNLQQKKTSQDYFLQSQDYPKVHKKSLSDSGDVMQFNSRVQQRNSQLYQYNELSHSMQTHKQNMIHGYPNYEGYQGYTYNSEYVLGEPRTKKIVPNERYTGRLKFFDQNGNYGFIVVDGYGTDLFVHFDDLQKTGIVKEKLLNIRNSQQMRFQFTCLEYDGKYPKSKKAVDLKPIPNEY